MEPFNWTCPFCNHSVVITDERISEYTHHFDSGNKYSHQAITIYVLVCSNPTCKEYTLTMYLADSIYTRGIGYQDKKTKQHWQLIPAASMKVFPDYIPLPILADYKEACLIKDLSPKASATLARRCLQGMIRDYWNVRKTRLIDEIEGIKEKVDPITWNAIDAVRNIGNIGAHMEKDINLVIDVEPKEAGVLIGLIEILIKEWYINRYEREIRMTQIISIAEEKMAEKNEGKVE